jgi:hypothetical protein
VKTTVSLERHLRELEERLLQPEVRKSAQDVDALLAEDFVEFGSSGGTYAKRQTIASLQTESAVRWSLTDFKIVQLAPDVVLTTYRAIRYGISGEQPTYSLRSSIWILIDGQWRMRFHQGTPSKETP